eukprot:jgi/Chlat1/518/Chrsp103S08597
MVSNPAGATAAGAVAPTVAKLRAAFDQGITRPLEWREHQLKQLIKMVKEQKTAFVEALQADLGRGEMEASVVEVDGVCATMTDLLKNVRKWAAPQKVKTPMSFYPGTAEVVPEPLGAVLIIAPWNFPLILLLEPLAAAIAAGNAVVGKPSEVSSHTSAALAKYVPQYIDMRAISIIEGGKDVVQQLLEQRWDHIFYTGGSSVGRIVMAAAAKHLTPVTLELGGKSPCYVDKDVDVKVVAKRMLSGKFTNAGQICVAPDYCLAHEKIAQPLLEACKDTIKEFYGEDPKASKDFARIISDGHFKRVSGILDEVKDQVFVGGATDPQQRFIAPTLLKDVPESAGYWKEEIFGPLLAVAPVPDEDAAIEFIRKGEKPLALYVFSNSSQVQQKIVSNTSSGGVCINDTVLHLGIPDLPFGGVGESGMGAYHGKRSFDTFSHIKGVAKKPLANDPALRYPPFTPKKIALLSLLIGGGSLRDWISWLFGWGKK